MRKIAQLLSAVLVSASLVGGVASAASADCSIVDTGANSNNVCVNKSENELSITCKNNVDVVFVNGQNSGSGNVTVTGNTTSGFSYSGNAVNTNSTTAKLDVGCAPATTTSTPPATGGQGGGTTSQPAAAPAAAPAATSLPSTGSNTGIVIAGVVTAVFAGTAAIARFGASAYRKF